MKHSSCSIVGHLHAAQHANLCADQTPHWPLEGSALGASGTLKQPPMASTEGVAKEGAVDANPHRDQPSRRRHKTDVKGKASRIEAHDEDG